MKGIALTTILLAAAGPACAGPAFERLLQEPGGMEAGAMAVSASAGVQSLPLEIYSSESYRANLPDCSPGQRYGLDANGVCVKETRRSQTFHPGACAKREIEATEPGHCRFERAAQRIKAAAGTCRFSGTRDIKYSMSYGLGFCESIGNCQARVAVVQDSSGNRVMEYAIHVVDEDCRCYKVSGKRRKTLLANPFDGPVWAKVTRAESLDSKACAAMMGTEAHKEAVETAYREIPLDF